MECDDDGLERGSGARGRSLKRKLGAAGAGVVRLAFSTAMPRGPAARAPAAPHEQRAAAPPVPAPSLHKPADSPFMNNMDEISYWVYTKRAPCLFNYDNTLKKQAEQAQPSTAKPPSVKSEPEDEQTPRKKRKLKLLDDNSASTEKRQNTFFKAPQNQKPPLGSCKSGEDGSDSDFVVEPPSTLKKPKNIKIPRNCQSRVPKKTKVSTPTPKAVILRRSRRKAQQNNINLDSSFEIFKTSVINGNQVAEAIKPDTVVADGTNSKSRSSGASRYPRRHKTNTADIPKPDSPTNIDNSKINTATRRYNMRKGTLNSNRKENSQEPVVSRTRSGRTRGLKLEDVEAVCPVPLKTSVEQISSTPAVNVACTNARNVKRSATTSRCLRSRTVKDKVRQLCKDSSYEGSDSKLDDGMPRALEQSSPKCGRKVKNTMEKSGNSLRDSHRDVSGYVECFTDSGSDSVPLKQKKFFC